jgi:hypothetical protein
MIGLETNHRDRLLRWFFIVATLAVPALVGYEIDYQFGTPPGGAPLDWQTGAVREVPPGSFAWQARVRTGDVVVRVGGVPFAEWNDLIIRKLRIPLTFSPIRYIGTASAHDKRYSGRYSIPMTSCLACCIL